jgi:hypothetical protein
MKIIYDISYRKRVEQFAAALTHSNHTSSSFVDVIRYMGSVLLTGRNATRIYTEGLWYSTFVTSFTLFFQTRENHHKQGGTYRSAVL